MSLPGHQEQEEAGLPFGMFRHYIAPKVEGKMQCLGASSPCVLCAALVPFKITDYSHLARPTIGAAWVLSSK